MRFIDGIGISKIFYATIEGLILIKVVPSSDFDYTDKEIIISSPCQ
ncbi:hypothetical protein NMS_2210 [Nonlabens marinus S1-08]|uniref:Uncharacterized protein n=1 Tax=Nonlabens marinus S1-08 TaxID=1454201 RepID=W8VRF9_9FLAO|nr:hypothetical protein NMS_2210 [Nonlabens marinus S1-08]